jgi:hypothetical protein
MGEELPAIYISTLDLSFLKTNTSAIILQDDKTPKDKWMRDYLYIPSPQTIRHFLIPGGFRPFGPLRGPLLQVANREPGPYEGTPVSTGSGRCGRCRRLIRGGSPRGRWPGN